MAISDNYTPNKTLGNGVTTQFSGSWNVINSAFMRVYLESVATGVQTLQTLNTHYTLSFNESGYTVTMLTPPTSANYVVRARSVTVDQGVPYKTSQGFQGAVQENSFDKLTAICQDFQDQIDRSIKFPLGSTLNLNLPTPEANKLIGWNGTADGISNYSIADLSTVPVTSFGASIIGAADAAAGRVVLGMGSVYAADLLDEDDMASNSATDVPSQQSTKAYVDGKVTLVTRNPSYYTAGTHNNIVTPAEYTRARIQGAGAGGGGGGSAADGGAGNATTVNDGTNTYTAAGGPGGKQQGQEVAPTQHGGFTITGSTAGLGVIGGGASGGLAGVDNSGGEIFHGGAGSNGGYFDIIITIVGGTTELDIVVGAGGAASGSGINSSTAGIDGYVIVEYLP